MSGCGNAGKDDDDPDVRELKQADAEYHRLCIDIQEPTLALEELRLDADELAVVAERLSRAGC